MLRKFSLFFIFFLFFSTLFIPQTLANMSVCTGFEDCAIPNKDGSWTPLCEVDEVCIDGEYCCPNYTGPEKKGYTGQIAKAGNGFACRCPQNMYWDSRNRECYSCPGNGTIWGKLREGFNPWEDLADENEGCTCPEEMPYYYNNALGSSTENYTCMQLCPEKSGNTTPSNYLCCSPETGYGCGCTYEYVAGSKGITVEELKERWKESSLINYVKEGSDGQLYPTYPGARTGTCTRFTTWTICTAPEWGIGQVIWPSCICVYPNQTGEDDGSIWSEYSCDLCPKGTVPSDEPTSYYKERNMVPYSNDYSYIGRKIPYCVKCSPTSVWVPGKGTKDDWSYWSGARCLQCPLNSSTDGEGEVALEIEGDDSAACRCKYRMMEYVSASREDVDGSEDGCYCPPGFYASKAIGDCDACTGLREYMDEYNDDGECDTCPDETPVAYKKGEVLFGNNSCRSCYDQALDEHNGALPSLTKAKVSWNGERCVSCSDNIYSGGVIWGKKDVWQEDGSTKKEWACISCYDNEVNKTTGGEDFSTKSVYWDAEKKECITCADAFGADKPIWDNDFYDEETGETGACVPCPTGSVWSPSYGSCQWCEYGLVWNEAQGTCVMDDGCAKFGLLWTEHGCMTCLEMNPECADIRNAPCVLEAGNCFSCSELCPGGNFNPEVVEIEGADGNYHWTVDCNCDENGGGEIW